MSHRRRNKPVEQLRTTWTSTEDLEETLQEMFVHSETSPPPAKLPSGVGTVSTDKLTVDLPEQIKDKSLNRRATELVSPVNLTADTRNYPPDILDISIINMMGVPPVNLAGGSPDKLTSVSTDKLAVETPDILAVDPTPDNLTAAPPDGLLYQTMNGTVVDSKCIRTYATVQEAHTPSEHLVYTTMWKMSGSAEEKAATSREAILPMQGIAAKVAISVRNLRRVLRSLEAKLAIEVTEYEDKTRSIPRRYRIWGFKAAMDRRRHAGYHFIYRNRNLITLAKLTRGAPDSLVGGAGDRLTGDSPASLTAPARVSLAAVSPDNQPHPPPASMSGSLIRKLISNSETITSSLIARSLEATVGHSDDDAVSRIIAGCRQVRGDATEEEIVHFIQLHGPRFCRMKHIGNPMGALITQLPRCFAGETFERYRQLEQQRREADRAQEAELRTEWQRVLDDPASSEDDRELARQLLGPE